MKKFKIFIDGQSGTTGMQITERLNQHEDIQLLIISEEDRKNREAKKKLMKESDLTILCLPDHAIQEAVEIATDVRTRIIDASSVNRVKEGWVYGLPELTSKQRDLIKNASKLANPGCYATGAILMLRPLIESRILDADSPINLFGISGYTGGGSKMAESYQNETSPSAFSLYSLSLAHKHIPEIKQWSMLENAPFFIPSVVNCDQGMLVIIPLNNNSLKLDSSNIYKILEENYQSESLIRVYDGLNNDDYLDISGLKNTSFCDIYIARGELNTMLVAKLDNLGKGASGAAVQNLNIMLGLPETKAVHLKL